MGPQEIEAGRVMPVVGVDVGVEGAGVNDQCDSGTSDARISSMRSDTSARPLRPAAAAPSRRRGPRWLSMASLVSSEMVIPRRCASWRRRASSSSGSLTVVRIMYASISVAELLPALASTWLSEKAWRAMSKWLDDAAGRVAGFDLCCIISCMTAVDETRSGRSARSTDSERRRELLRETDRYLAELIEEIGEPPSEVVAEAEAWAERIVRHLKKAPHA